MRFSKDKNVLASFRASYKLLINFILNSNDSFLK